MKKTKHRVFRNPLYNHPLMKKGAAHGKSNKTKRIADRVQIKKSVFSDDC